MTNFTKAIQTKFALFQPVLNLKIEISSDLFTTTKGKVADFVQEMEQNCQLLTQQTEPLYAQFYAQRLIQQFELLKVNVEKQQRTSQNSLPTFKSNYRFAKNLEKLPACKRRDEYQKALRALNEKINWLTEQSYLYPSKTEIFQAQIQETEYRKQKCLHALDQL